ERVSLTGTGSGPDAARWHHYEASAIPPSEAELAAAVSAMSRFDTASLSSDGLTLTLGLASAHSATATSDWDSADTAAVPDTIGYSFPSTGMSDLADEHGNALALNTVDSTVADGAPPEAVGLTMAVLSGGTSGAEKTGEYALIAGSTDAVRVTAMLSEPSSTSTPPELRMFGTSQVMTLSASDETATAAIAVSAAMEAIRDGPIAFGIDASDVRAPPNAATFTQDDLTGPQARVDVSIPEIVSVLLTSATRIQIDMSEDIRGTGMVTVREQPSDAGTSAPLLIRPMTSSGHVAVADLALDAGTGYTFAVETSVTDLAGNAFVEKVVVPVSGEYSTDTYIAPPSAPYDIELTMPTVRGSPDGPFRFVTDDIEAVTDPAPPRTPLDANFVVRVGGITVTIYPGTQALSLGPQDAGETLGTLLVELSERVEGETYAGAPGADDIEQAANDRAARAITSLEPAILGLLGKRDDSSAVIFSQPVSIRLAGVGGTDHVFYMVRDAATATQMNVVSIPTCSSAGLDASATQAPALPAAMADGTGIAECYVGAGGDVVVWTNHFTQFGASVQGIRTGGGDCDDCTPPTLGVDSTGARRVAGGFSYNGDTVDSEYYYTPLPLITVETGAENVAVLKVFEDSGARNVRHVGLGFGLTRGQHFAESSAEIRVALPFMGNATVTIDDPAGAIDPGTLRAEAEIGECMPGSAAECRIVTIHHTFREPLDFNVVSTIIWDDRRNAWQNFFNHGVHVTGESLNPRHGIEVNGGELVLYPLISGQVDEDGDGIYDYDERHVTYMLDAEYRVYRLAPDGTYQPVRNLASIHHDVDESMYDEERSTSHGPSRGTDIFGEVLEREREIAQEYLAMMGIRVPEGDGGPGYVAGPEPADEEAELQRLRERIAREINLAELAMQELYPEMDGHPEADAPARAAEPEPADEEAELQRLRERIAREMELAELAMQELYPEVTGGEGAGAQDDGTP
ncbi:MAG: hypothetical protein EB832_05215, partial [Thaumarchaeota archaeon S14]